MFGDKSLQFLKKKRAEQVDFAPFWPVNLFASRKAGKHKQESFDATRWCLFAKTYINRFSGVLSTKIQRKYTLKLEYAVDMKFLSGKWI